MTSLRARVTRGMFEYVHTHHPTGFQHFVGQAAEDKAETDQRLHDADLLDLEITQSDDSSPAEETSDDADQPSKTTDKRIKSKQPLLPFIDSLPNRKKELLAAVTPDMDSGITNKMSGAAITHGNSLTILCITGQRGKMLLENLPI